MAFVLRLFKNFFTKLFFYDLLHLRLVLLFPINLIENYKIKCLPRELNPETHYRNGFLFYNFLLDSSEKVKQDAHAKIK